MSDIYLAISETPTVVTLTSAVIASSASSTVTVSNTVTVALDANSLSALENVTVTVGAAITGTVTVSNSVTIGSLPAISGTVTVGNSVNINSLPSIRINPNYDGQGGNNGPVVEADSDLGSDPRYMVFAGGADNTSGEFRALTFDTGNALKVAGTVTVGNTVTIAGTVTIGAGTAQIGSVTASLAISSTAITSGSFASLTSATLVPGNVARKMATVYNLGAGQLFVNAGATATTLGGGFMVALSSGDYFECGFTTTTLSALFATAGTCSWMSH